MMGLELIVPPLLVLAPMALAASLNGVVMMARGQSMLPDALSHSVLPGVVVAAWLRGSALGPWTIMIGALVASVVAVGLIQLLERGWGANRGAALAVVYPSMLSLGLVLTALTGLDRTGFDAHMVLFGSFDFLFWPEAMGFFSLSLTDLLVAFRSAPLGFGFGLTGFATSVIVFVSMRRALTTQLFDPLEFRLNYAGSKRWLLEGATAFVLLITAVAAFLTVGAVMTVAMFAAPALAARPGAHSLVGWFSRAALMASLFVAATYGAIIGVPEQLLPALGILDSPLVLGISVAGTYAMVASGTALLILKIDKGRN